MEMKRSSMIVIEGLDGSGKTTQFKLFCMKLREMGYDVVETREPTRNMIGDLISRRLKEKTDLPNKVNGLIYTLLFYADRVEHNFGIKKELQNGKIVVSDRYYHSTLAYQQTQGLDTKLLLNFHKNLVVNGYVREPDLTFFIDLPAEVAMERIEGRVSKKDKVHIFEHLEFLKKLRKNYLKLQKLLDEKIVVIDGRGTPEEVGERVWKSFQV